jgi:hypothetical protein
LIKNRYLFEHNCGGFSRLLGKLTISALQAAHVFAISANIIIEEKVEILQCYVIKAINNIVVYRPTYCA